MLKCPQCGALHPVKINKINGLTRKNQNAFCSDACWHKHNRASGNVKPRASKYRPRSQKPASYHCCMFCGKESMKRLDKDDPNKFCSLACSFESSKRVTREAKALRRIGDGYARHVREQKAKEGRIIKAHEAQERMAKYIERISSKCCKDCGAPLGLRHRENGPTQYCKHCAGARKQEMRRLEKKRRRAAKAERLPSWYGEFDQLVWSEASRLTRSREKATGLKWHADHMIPMKSQEASGLHVWNNCQVIPAYMNVAKHTSMVLVDRGAWVYQLRSLATV